MLTLLPFVSIMPVLVNVIARVPGEVIAPLACNVPPVKISVFVTLPLPSAALEFAFRMPVAIVVAPLYVLALG
jgi:hypothetical protein